MTDRTRLRVFTWHLHGGYLFYLAHGDYEIYVPVRPGRPIPYVGASPGFRWPPNVTEIPADRVRDITFDCVLFQSRTQYFEEQFEILSDEQRRLPQIYLEHDPPLEHPTETRHPVDDPDVLLVHVTPFNELMWNSGRTPTRVIEHGVVVPEGARYSGHVERGITAVNNLYRRGRRTGPDIFDRARAEVPIDLAGMGSEDIGGLGDMPLDRLLLLEGTYRFFFNPIRYTSLGLAVCEAMMLGMPVAGLATAEMATAVDNGVSGVVDTDLRKVIEGMRELLRDRGLARRMGDHARQRALDRFGIERFVREWKDAFETVTGKNAGRSLQPVGGRTAEW
ncbi:MAG: glycosyltransferase [Actinomycetota bacterium]|nr:glycosyltransferase [Actinomycetota bacterium]